MSNASEIVECDDQLNFSGKRFGNIKKREGRGRGENGFDSQFILTFIHHNNINEHNT